MPTNEKPRKKPNMTRANKVRAILETGKPIPAKGVPVLIPAAIIARIDAVKDPLIPRTAFVRDLVDKALRIHEQGAQQGTEA